VCQQELPNVPGRSIKGVLVEYGPGGCTPGHTHPKSAFPYATVLEGTIRSQVNDRPVKTYQAGQSFSELPGDRRGVSANASTTKPTKVLAVFVVYPWLSRRRHRGPDRRLAGARNLRRGSCANGPGR
jgi:quercetin dioxygenase-like cupin family protein